ncbi:hypothetical protein V6N13_061886 [Hibiscus sabdariffa]
MHEHKDKKNGRDRMHGDTKVGSNGETNEHGVRLPTGSVIWIRRMYLLDIKGANVMNVDLLQSALRPFAQKV